MKKNQNQFGHGIEKLAQLFPSPETYARNGQNQMDQAKQDGKKRIHIRTAIVAVLMAITAFLCFYFWSVNYAIFLFLCIVGAACVFGALVYALLYAHHRSKENEALRDTTRCIQNREEKYDAKFSQYCKDLGNHVTTRKVWLRNALIVFFALAVIVLLAKGLTPTNTPVGPTPTVNVTTDPNVTDPIQKDQQEEIDRLNKKLEEGYITFSVNKSPYFATGDSEGNLNIINLEENNYPQMVELYMLDENGELGEKLYQSGTIPVGKAIPYAKLNVDLDAGEYRVMAVIHAVDEETGFVLGTVNTPLSLTVGG